MDAASNGQPAGGRPAPHPAAGTFGDATATAAPAAAAATAAISVAVASVSTADEERADADALAAELLTDFKPAAATVSTCAFRLLPLSSASETLPYLALLLTPDLPVSSHSFSMVVCHMCLWSLCCREIIRAGQPRTTSRRTPSPGWAAAATATAAAAARSAAAAAGCRWRCGGGGGQAAAERAAPAWLCSGTDFAAPTTSVSLSVTLICVAACRSSYVSSRCICSTVTHLTVHQSPERMRSDDLQAAKAASSTKRTREPKRAAAKPQPAGPRNVFELLEDGASDVEEPAAEEAEDAGESSGSEDSAEDVAVLRSGAASAAPTAAAGDGVGSAAAAPPLPPDSNGGSGSGGGWEAGGRKQRAAPAKPLAAIGSPAAAGRGGGLAAAGSREVGPVGGNVTSSGAVQCRICSWLGPPAAAVRHFWVGHCCTCMQLDACTSEAAA